MNGKSTRAKSKAAISSLKRPASSREVASSRQEQSGLARSSQQPSGAVKSSQDQPGATRGSQERSSTARRQLEVAVEQPGAVSSDQDAAKR